MVERGLRLKLPQFISRGLTSLESRNFSRFGFPITARLLRNWLQRTQPSAMCYVSSTSASIFGMRLHHSITWRKKCFGIELWRSWNGEVTAMTMLCCKTSPLWLLNAHPTLNVSNFWLSWKSFTVWWNSYTSLSTINGGKTKNVVF